MIIRKLLNFNGSLGLTIPQEYCKTLDFHSKDYVEIYFASPDKIVIKKHKILTAKGAFISG